MQIEIPVGLIFQTVLTGIIGYCIKYLMDGIKSYQEDSRKWRSRMDKTMDNINNATQATMRTSILHYCEKYLSRDWITSEELASLLDMHEKYAALNDHNGFIDSYINRVKNLDIREV